jgi:hypothetical protein
VLMGQDPNSVLRSLPESAAKSPAGTPQTGAAKKDLTPSVSPTTTTPSTTAPPPTATTPTAPANPLSGLLRYLLGDTG